MSLRGLVTSVTDADSRFLEDIPDEIIGKSAPPSL